MVKVFHRNDLSQGESVAGLLTQDAPSATIPYLSTTTSNAFQKQCKIFYNKLHLVQPSMSVKCSLKKNRIRAKPWTGRYQANSDDYHVIKGDQTLLYFIWGYPSYINDITVNNFRLMGYRMNILTTRYFSYYAMDDAIPTSTNFGQLPNDTSGTVQSSWYTNRIKTFDTPTPSNPPVGVTTAGLGAFAVHQT